MNGTKYSLLLHAYTNSLAAASGHAHLALPGCLCTKQALTVLANSWSMARNSQEDQPSLLVSSVGTQSPTWTMTNV